MDTTVCFSGCHGFFFYLFQKGAGVALLNLLEKQQAAEECLQSGSATEKQSGSREAVIWPVHWSELIATTKKHC